MMMMTLFIEIAIIAAFGAIRVMRGGYGRWQPPRWLMAVMAPAIVIGLTFNIYLAAISLLISAQYVSGYKDIDNDDLVGWEDAFWDMAFRVIPSGAVVLCCAIIDILGLHTPNYTWLLVALSLVIFANVGQPRLRSTLANYGHWSNRTAEGLEGAALGFLTVSLTL